MYKKIGIATLFTLVLAFSSTANATDYPERESLAKLLHELEAINGIVNEAQSRANPDARIHFQYKALRKDLEKIRLGVKEYLDTPTIEPRKYAPLSGDYRR